MKRVLFLVAVVALGLAPGTAPVQAETHGTTCGLTGKSFFDGSGLTMVPDTYGFSFRGKLTDCESSGKVKTGKVSARGVADAGCAVGTTKGKALVEWNTGKTTTIRFATTDVGASVTLDGKVVKSSEKSFSKGDAVLGQLAFEADATKCVEGLKSANFTGQVLGGSPS
jgi:hypothetical protein